jgi:hypothetical protein
MLRLNSVPSFLVLSLATFISLACTSTDAAAQYYGAIAFSQSSGAVGFSYNFRRRDIAEERALEECGGGCRVVTWFRNACGALATGNGNGYGTGWATNRGTAERIALNKCGENARSCRVIRWACTSR